MENYWHLSCGRSWKGVQKPTVSSHNGHPERSPVLNLGGKTTPSVLFCFLATLPHFPFFSCFTSSLFFTSSPYVLSPMPIGFPTSSENSSSLNSSISSCLCCLSESFCSKFNASACDGVLSCCFSPYLSILCFFFFSLALLSWPLWVPLSLYSHTFPRLYLFVSLCPTQLPVSTLSPSLFFFTSLSLSYLLSVYMRFSHTCWSKSSFSSKLIVSVSFVIKYLNGSFSTLTPYVGHYFLPFSLLCLLKNWAFFGVMSL